ncbi:hypothetical protein ACVWYF_002798 [Hymenobacter sp. UYAg731]
MTYTERHLVETYAGLFEGLSALSKRELMDSLAQSLKASPATKESRFYQSFGAFASEKSAEEIVAELKAGRQFQQREINF